MIKQALNAPTVATIMRTFAKDDAIKLLGKSTYDKWLKKLPDDSIARRTALSDGYASTMLHGPAEFLKRKEAIRLRQEPDISDALMNRYGPGFEANLPQVNRRWDTRGRLKGAVLRTIPRVNYLHEFTNRNNLVSRNELLRWNRSFNAGLDPKTLTSEWYVKPTGYWDDDDAAVILNDSHRMPSSTALSYNGKKIPADVAYLKAQLVRNMAAVPYTDPIRHTSSRLVANELNDSLYPTAARRSVYNSVSDNTRKVLNYVNGRNVLEDPRALRLVDAANKHGRLDIDISSSYKDGTNAAYLPTHNILAVHPRLTQNTKNHEYSHYLLNNMDAQKHADIAGRVFRNLDAISRKNPKYSGLASKLIDLPDKAHEAVTDYYRHKLFGTLGSRAADLKAGRILDTDLRFAKPMIDHVVSETQNLTSNPSLQQALQQLAVNYGVRLSRTDQIPDSVRKLANRAVRWERIKQTLRNLFKLPWNR